MSRPLLLFLGAVSCLAGFGQARLVFNNAGTAVNQHPFIVFNPAANAGTYLVIDNGNANAITMTGAVTSDVPIIKSEREENKIRWAIGNNTGTYTIPFASARLAAGVSIPLTMQVTGAGSAGGSMVFSTYNSQSIGVAVANGWNNDAYRPSDVTHMLDNPTGSVNNSANAIDRFWIIDAGEGSYAYATKPSVNITFGFDPVESQINDGNTTQLNSINNNLVAQRFNPGLGKWYDVLPYGTQTGSMEVTGVTPAPGDFYRSWTLSNIQVPLPIQLVDWDGKCDGKVVHLTWTTASEQNNDYFTIEKSRDNDSWTAIGTVPGAGNSSQMISYSFVDPNAVGRAYYRLRQTDIDGRSEVSPTIVAGCGTENGTTLVNAWDDGINLNLEVSSSLEGLFDLTLMDAQGKIVSVHPSQAIHNGITILQIDKRDIATGVYVVRLHNKDQVMSRRIHVH